MMHPHAQTKCGARVAICEGDKKGFAVKFVKGEEGKVVVFKKGGCLGTSSFIGKPYNKSSDAIDLSWPEEEGVPQVRACRQETVHAVFRGVACLMDIGTIASGLHVSWHTWESSAAAALTCLVMCICTAQVHHAIDTSLL